VWDDRLIWSVGDRGLAVRAASGYGIRLVELDGPGMVAWDNSNLRSHFSNLALVGEHLYGIHSDQQDGARCELRCMRLSDGQALSGERLGFGNLTLVEERLLFLTAWEAGLPGGCLATGAAVADIVVFASVAGDVCGYHVEDGRTLWRVTTGRAITGAPCLVGEHVYVANHGGVVTSIDVRSGRLLSKSARLGAAVQGSLAATSDAVYAVAEDLKVYALDADTGQIVATRQIHGQSFRLQWPVIHAGKLWVRTAPVWCVGSEYVNDTLLATATSLEDEEAKFLTWLEGKAVFGPHSSKNDWKSFFALNLPDLEEPFTIPCGPSEGCGQPPNPPVVTSQGELLAWWPTRYPALIERGGVFGTRYSIDLAAVDAATGRRKPLDAGPPAHVWPLETDNLYALTTGGRFCYWRQRFRGTYAFDLQARRHHQVQVEVRDRDGGVWNAPIMYVDRREDALPRTPSTPTAGRIGATVANGRLYLSENYGVLAIEHAGGNAP